MNDELQTLVVDVEQTDHVRRSRYAILKREGVELPLEDACRTDPIPEEYMERLEDCLGDGLAGVSVSGDLADSDYGTKAGAMVNVRVTCGNTAEEILAAHSIAKEMMKEMVAEDFSEMQDLLQQKLAGPAPSPPATTTTKQPTQRRPVKVGGTTKAVARQPVGRAPAKATTRKPATRPKFKR